LNCNVLDITNQTIVCDLEEGVTELSSENSDFKFIKGQGVEYTYYNLQDTDVRSSSSLRNRINSADENPPIIS